MGYPSGATHNQEEEGVSSTVRRHQPADTPGEQQRGATPYRAQAVGGKNADHADQWTLRHVAQSTSVMEGGPRLTHQPTCRESSAKRDQDKDAEEQRPVRRDWVRSYARRVDDPELRHTRIFELPGQAGGFAPR